MPAEGDWATKTYMARMNRAGTDMLRVRLRTERGLVVQFSVQDEAMIDDQWLPVVRYDTAPGYAHRDRLDRRGRNIEKLDLGSPNRYSEVFTNALNDTKTN